MQCSKESPAGVIISFIFVIGGVLLLAGAMVLYIIACVKGL